MSQRFLLYAIDDDKWHSISELAKMLEWPEQNAVDIARYLAKGSFIHFDEETGKVRLQPWVKKFPRGEWIGPGKRSTGSVNIPPEGSITLQETLVQNDLGVQVELHFLVEDNKLVELLISKGKQEFP